MTLTLYWLLSSDGLHSLCWYEHGGVDSECAYTEMLCGMMDEGKQMVLNHHEKTLHADSSWPTVKYIIDGNK
jgi:hypothetical protein